LGTPPSCSATPHRVASIGRRERRGILRPPRAATLVATSVANPRSDGDTIASLQDHAMAEHLRQPAESHPRSSPHRPNRTRQLVLREAGVLSIGNLSCSCSILWSSSSSKSTAGAIIVDGGVAPANPIPM